jgi:uncharacterized protein YbgA (DUF1722 family)/uncharacterized protein YbbK (DUF523 family)
MSDLHDENKPTVVVSRCLGFCKCRYNGDVITDKFVQELGQYVNFITVCPEVDIGLGIPRNPVRLVLENDFAELYQPSNDKNYTSEMISYAETFFESLGPVHGFILKGRSPSCGIKDVKIYKGKEKGSGSVKGVGLFASFAMNLYQNLPIEEEGRLTNYAIREHFLTKLYTFFRFEKVKNSHSMKDLVKFHSDHKYLLLAYNQNQSKILGKIVANHEKKHFKEITDEYESHLGMVFAKMPNKNNYINTFLHIMGYFSDGLTSREKKFILDRFQKYREDKLHISVVLNLLRTYVIKYNLEYLLDQVIWTTYPEELLDISDSGK